MPSRTKPSLPSMRGGRRHAVRQPLRARHRATVRCCRVWQRLFVIACIRNRRAASMSNTLILAQAQSRPASFARTPSFRACGLWLWPLLGSFCATPATASPYYDLQVVAQTGQATSTGDTLTALDDDGSINDRGSVAFIGRIAAGE